MLGLASIVIIAAVVLTALPAGAQPSEPYRAVTVKLAEPPDDPSFAVFRGNLATVAERRVYSELSRLVVARGFFWERDFDVAFVATRPGVENLAIAIGLERGGGRGWAALATFAVEPTAAPFAPRPGAICAPARPQFDEAEYYMLLAKTGTEADDWAYPRRPAVAMLAAARASGTTVETLGLYLVRVLGRKEGSTHADWTHVAAPSGRTGFVAPGLLLSLSAERLCYRKDVTGRWAIAGFVGGGD